MLSRIVTRPNRNHDLAVILLKKKEITHFAKGMSWTPSSTEKTKKLLEAHAPPPLVIKVEPDIEPPTSLFFPPSPPLPPPVVPSLQLQPRPQSGSRVTEFPPPAFRRQTRPGRMMPKERVVSKGQLKEKVNYPPHEQQQSEYNRQKLLEMELYPSDGVGSYPRSIPFKGSKEDFLRKTGRNRFDGERSPRPSCPIKELLWGGGGREKLGYNEVITVLLLIYIGSLRISLHSAERKG